MSLMRLAACLAPLSAAIWVASATAATGPSFDCAKASTPVDRAICGSPELSALDWDMAQAYRRAMDAAGERGAPLLRSQRRWLADRAKLCTGSGTDNPACLAAAYRARIAGLQVLGRPPADACAVLAETARAAGGFPEGRYGGELSHGLSLSGGPLHLDLDEEPLTREWANRLPLSEEFKDWSSNHLAQTMLRAETDPPVIVVQAFGGSLSCQRMEWFIRDAAGSWKAMEAPETPGDGEGYCYNEVGYLGEFEGAPALAVGRGQLEEASLRLLRLGRAGWEPRCTITVHYKSRLALTEEFCAGEPCATLRREAVGWAVAAAAQDGAEPTPPPGLAPSGFAGNADEGPMARLPTLGRTANADMLDFATGSPIFRFDGQGGPYLVRISKGTRGWRESDDYLVGIFRSGAGGTEPVAGYVVSKQRDGLDRLDVK
ncbi:lysozyme inhibitor LprI family protein [Arenibaculum pallidiluteum]|uniref:lysozyme inhibitor LprI family protein n=1 Tax=Arenibaculum pallidiluteum TaxID=2812559 RepID=UPI001A978726|nr:lysozyme inhibitor LprI family protein [Arenibaculum pallidiluteum]